MAVLDSPINHAELREALRNLSRPFLLRGYEATPQEYEQITDEDLKCEYVDGELIVHSPASLRHEDLTLLIASLLREFVTGRRLGRVYGSNAVMQLGERRFSPDVSVLLNVHAERIQGERVRGPMDLVVEVVSRSTRDYDFRTKLPAYREGHVGEIWLVDPDRRLFEVHALRGENYVTQALATGRWSSLALPGFAVDVDWFWADPPPPLAECRTD
jgi:Uma2 family endonuclease